MRIITNNSEAKHNLNEKYGVPIDQINDLLKIAKKLNLRIKGVSFHVGTGGVCFETYLSSIKNARMVFDLAEKLGMEKMDLLDIGGGYTLLNPMEVNNFVTVAT